MFIDERWIDALTPSVIVVALSAIATAIAPRPTPASRAVILLISAGFMANYAWWRLTQTLPAARFSAEYAVGIIFLAFETAGTLAAALSLLFLTRSRDRSCDSDNNAQWLKDEAQDPQVDVLICSYNEEQAIVERTIVGAMAMDYANFRVFMLDDGRREWLKQLCARLECGYIARPTNEHAKAGNINYALKQLAALPDPPRFISILDADFVPAPRFLRRAVALFRDEGLGIVQTPQHFINADPIQANLNAARYWPDEQRFFFDIVMPAKDAWSAAFCCGTSSVIRFKPLQAIGGFPTDSVTEDYLLTLRMKESGYATAYLNEPLTCGLAPEGLKEYVTQRSRWCLGFMQIARGRSGPFSLTSPLAFIDRLSLFETFLNWTVVYATRGVGLVIPIISLLFDMHPFNAPLQEVATHFLPYFLWHGLAMHWLSNGRLMPILSDVSQLIMIPQVLKAVIVGLGRPQGHKFQVTAKGGDRRRRFVEWSLMRPFATLIALSVLAIVYAFHINERAELTAYAGPAVAWIWYNMLILTVLCFVCVEQPRRRGAERFHSGEIASIRATSVGRPVQVADFSITGARILGKPPDAPGGKILLEFSDCSVEAKIVRVTSDSFAIEFDKSLRTRIAMIRHFYAGDYVRPLNRIEVLKVGAAVMRRMLN